MKKGNLADIQQGQALLDTACPATRERLALWSAYREGAQSCGEKSMDALKPGLGSVPAQPAWDERAARAGAAARLARDINRAEAAVLRLRLVAGEDLTEADGPLAKLKSSKGADEASWKQLADALKKARKRADDLKKAGR
jgi:hypothetical protein